MIIITLGANLVQVSDCVCPGYMLIYKCTVMGENSQYTVWTGTAFDCLSTNNMIILLHDSTMIKQCGSIKANIISEGNGYYTSQLNIAVRPEFIGETVECIYNDGRTDMSVGNMIIASNKSG